MAKDLATLQKELESIEQKRKKLAEQIRLARKKEEEENRKAILSALEKAGIMSLSLDEVLPLIQSITAAVEKKSSEQKSQETSAETTPAE